MSGEKMHRRGLGKAVALGAVAIFALMLSAGTASAALLTLDDVTLPGDPILIVNGANDGDAGGAPPAGEPVTNAIDDTTNKHLNFLDYGSGFIVTPTQRFGGAPTVVRAIRIYTANDRPDRDPASFLLEGSNAATAAEAFGLNDTTDSVIYGSNITLPGNRNPTSLALDPNTQDFASVAFENTTSYRHYRVTFPTLRDGEMAESVQYAEVELLGVPEPGTVGLLAIGALGLLRRRR